MKEPVFGFLAVTSGSFEGAIIRDMRLANELYRRGFRVVVYWLVQQNRGLVAPGIPQRVVGRATRYMTRRPTRIGEMAGRLFDLLPAERRIRFLQTHPRLAQHLACNLTGVVCDARGDEQLVGRLTHLLRRDGVTHLLPTFAFACPFALAAKRRGGHDFEYLVTFQGEELFVGYARTLGREREYFAQLRAVIAGSPWKAIAVSRDYVRRLQDEMGIDPKTLTVVHPGIDLPAERERGRPDFGTLQRAFPRLRADLPIVTFLGRNDPEKGIDLLLYAARMLQQRGRSFQLVVAGGTTFGCLYRQACEQVAQHLRLDVHWQGRVDAEVRDALYALSRCVVYPPVHREPFGMVAVEALSRGTPVLVPDHGGLTEAIAVDGRRAGITFRVWDSGNLADQLERLLVDDALHAELARNGPTVAATFGVATTVDRLLAHMGIGPRSGERLEAPPCTRAASAAS
jgi:glycosyltransferase involved in cell wall biosynthesis